MKDCALRKWIVVLVTVFGTTNFFNPMWAVSLQQDKTNLADSTATADTSVIADSSATPGKQATHPAPEPKLGDVSDGSRAVPVHLIDIFDETGSRIRLDERPLMPFSTKQTCQECHAYDSVRTGWHFNAADTTVPPGRPGEPWILTDPITATQLPLSYRNWPGIFHPDAVGLIPWDFVQKFGRQMPGGGVGEDQESDPPELFFRRQVSGVLEINCLACHNADPGQDQAEYALQIARQNFRWAATGASNIADAYGTAKDMPDNYDIYFGVDPDNPRNIPPSVEYHQSEFNSKGKVLFDIVRRIPNERCYFCHSTKIIDKEYDQRWQAAEDVHLKAGMICVDCHRNGLTHAMVRGYEGEAQEYNNPTAAEFTCEGCHLGGESGSAPGTGRLGAPMPQHKGIPGVHFKKLACTACHSGPWPQKTAAKIKTSCAHALGTHNVQKSDDALPYLQEPVFVKQRNGKIAPHRLLWPTFWAYLEGDSLRPINPEIVAPVILAIIKSDTVTDSTNFARIRSGTWPEITDTLLVQALRALSDQNASGDSSAGKRVPVFVSAGKIHRLPDSSPAGSPENKIIVESHPAAQPVSWPLAHDVRPASQSLGVRGCKDCHAVSSPFYFGNVAVFSPLASEQEQYRSMTAFNRLGKIYPRTFALTFLFRPWFKFVLIISSMIIALVLLLYVLRGLEAMIRRFS